MARINGYAQKLDKFWKQTNCVWDNYYRTHGENATSNIQELRYIVKQVIAFEPQNNYEMRDKANLLYYLEKFIKDFSLGLI